MKLKRIIILSIVFILFSIFFFNNISPPEKFEFNEEYPNITGKGGYTKNIVLEFDTTPYGELRWNEEVGKYVYSNLDYFGEKNASK